MYIKPTYICISIYMERNTVYRCLCTRKSPTVTNRLTPPLEPDPDAGGSGHVPAPARHQQLTLVFVCKQPGAREPNPAAAHNSKWVPEKHRS